MLAHPELAGSLLVSSGPPRAVSGSKGLVRFLWGALLEPSWAVSAIPAAGSLRQSRAVRG
eukprot:5374374-Pyramimonas_sp.AAC.1